jgi:Cytochrome c554 and c-prime
MAEAPWRGARVFALALLASCLGGAALGEFRARSPAAQFDGADYWRMPLKPQGSRPSGWTPLESSLAPADCGGCHAEQFEQWRTSRHSQAFSPGLVGQLLTYDAATTAGCLQCHAPLAEQRVIFEANRAQGADVREGLAAAGNACAGCHVRRHQRFGPPQRGTGATGRSRARTPHGGVFRTAAFESSEFCSPCHQFRDELAVNGKPLENTYVEWKESPQGAQRLTCQSCHMPDRRHLWRGIHDPAMVAAGLTARTSVSEAGARFEIVNSGIAHAFPTYAVPRVVMHAIMLDRSGAPEPQTERTYVIARIVINREGKWIEVSDTRLLPGQAAALDIAWSGGDRARVWLEVLPDFDYAAEVYPHLLEALPPASPAAQLIAEASADAARSHFRLFETELRRP